MQHVTSDCCSVLGFPRPSYLCEAAFICSLLGSSEGGKDQEPGEGVGGAGLGGDDGVVLHRDQGNSVSRLQLQDGGAGREQEAFRHVAHTHVALLPLHQLQTHLSGGQEQKGPHKSQHKIKECSSYNLRVNSGRGNVV